MQKNHDMNKKYVLTDQLFIGKYTGNITLIFYSEIKNKVYFVLDTDEKLLGSTLPL